MWDEYLLLSPGVKCTSYITIGARYGWSWRGCHREMSSAALWRHYMDITPEQVLIVPTGLKSTIKKVYATKQVSECKTKTFKRMIILQSTEAWHKMSDLHACHICLQIVGLLIYCRINLSSSSFVECCVGKIEWCTHCLLAVTSHGQRNGPIPRRGVRNELLVVRTICSICVLIYFVLF